MLNGSFTVTDGVMFMSLSNIAYIVLAVLIVILFSVTQCQRVEKKALKAEMEQATAHADELQAQLSEALAQRDADRKRMIETVRRIDGALTLFVNNSEEAHDEHEERMESLFKMDSPETVDWLCEPVPDDIRMLLGCDAGTGGHAGSEIQSADSSDAAMP